MNKLDLVLEAQNTDAYVTWSAALPKVVLDLDAEGSSLRLAIRCPSHAGGDKRESPTTCCIIIKLDVACIDVGRIGTRNTLTQSSFNCP